MSMIRARLQTLFPTDGKFARVVGHRNISGLLVRPRAAGGNRLAERQHRMDISELAGRMCREPPRMLDSQKGSGDCNATSKGRLRYARGNGRASAAIFGQCFCVIVVRLVKCVMAVRSPILLSKHWKVNFGHRAMIG